MKTIRQVKELLYQSGAQVIKVRLNIYDQAERKLVRDRQWQWRLHEEVHWPVLNVVETQIRSRIEQQANEDLGRMTL